MNVTFALSDPVKRNNDVFLLHVETMSGDADAYASATAEYRNTPEGVNELREHTIILLSLQAALQNVARRKQNSVIDNTIKQLFSEHKFVSLTERQVDEWLWEFVKSDVINSDYRAAIQRVWITYIQHDYRELNVNITVNGKTLLTESENDCSDVSDE